MRRRWKLVEACGVAAAVGVFAAVSAFAANDNANARAVCPAPPSEYTHCHALVATDAHGNPDASTSPTGLSPATIKSVYGFSTSSTAGAGKTIAIVDAYDDPTAESDLAIFSSQYGLPACTTANGCFKKVNQTGGTVPAQGCRLGAGDQPRRPVGARHRAGREDPAGRGAATASPTCSPPRTTPRPTPSTSRTAGAAPSSAARPATTPTSSSPASASSSPPATPDCPRSIPSASPNVISVGGTTLTFQRRHVRQRDRLDRRRRRLQRLRDRHGRPVGFQRLRAGRAAAASARPLTSRSTPTRPRACPSTTAPPTRARSGWFKIGGTSAQSPMWAARSAVAGAVVNAAYVYGTQHHLPRHHLRQQRRALPGRLRPLHRPRQLDRRNSVIQPAPGLWPSPATAPGDAALTSGRDHTGFVAGGRGALAGRAGAGFPRFTVLWTLGRGA